jgi:hypothetical protein
MIPIHPVEHLWLTGKGGELFICQRLFLMKKEKPGRMIEDPTQIQAHILAAFGYKAAGGVLKNIIV